MSHIDAGPLSTYNSLMDKHLAGYFSNSKMRRHLKKSGLITRRGEIVSQNQYRHNMAKKEHKQHVKDLLAQAIVHKTLDMERMRQVAIKKKLEEIAKIELVRRVKTDRQRQGDEDILPYLSPRPNSAAQRPKTSPARGRPKDPYSRPDARLGFLEHPDSSPRRPIYIDVEGRPISPRDEKYPKEEIDTRHLYGLDNVALREYTMTLDESKKGKLGASPYVQSQLPDDAKIPSPPRTSRSVQSAGSKRRFLRPLKQRGTLHRQEPPMTHPSRLQSLCEVTIRYHGENLQLAHEVLGDPRHEVLVEQQHCGGNTLIVYKDLLMPGTDFQFLSRRHRGYPFSLSFYVNGVMSARLSTCCEFKHTPGFKIGGKQGHFGLVGVNGGLGPCYKCQVEKQVKESQKKKEPKPAKEEKVESEEEKGEEDYEDDFDDDDDDDKSSKRDKDDEKDGGAGGAIGHGGDSSSDAGDNDSVPEEPDDEGKKGGDKKGKASGGEQDKDEGVVSSDSEVEEKSDKVVVAADVHASDDEKVESVAESETEEKKDVASPEKVASPVAIEPAAAPESEVTSPRESAPTSPRESVTSPKEDVASTRDSAPTSPSASAVVSPREASPAPESPLATPKEPEPETTDESEISDSEGDDADADYSSTTDTESRTETGSESDVGAYLALKPTTPTLEPGIEHSGSISTIIDNKPHIDLSSIQLNKTQVKELCEDVAQRDDIQSVVVRNGKLDDKSIGKLTESILATPSEVKMLNFNLNRITPEGARHVATIVKERPKIQVLLLHGNPLGDDGVKEIVDAVEHLKIAAEPKPMSPVSDFGSQTSARSTESEEGTPIRSVAKDLVKGVMDDVMQSSSLQELQPGQKFELLQIDLGDTTMSDKGASHVARMIAFDTPISTLNLTGNMNIKRTGWQSISDALKRNTHLRVLTLDYTMLGDEGMEILAEGLKQNVTLHTLDLEGNFISDKGGDTIINLLSVNTSIKNITVMPGNKLSEEKQSQIKDALDARKSS